MCFRPAIHDREASPPFDVPSVECVLGRPVSSGGNDQGRRRPRFLGLVVEARANRMCGPQSSGEENQVEVARPKPPLCCVRPPQRQGDAGQRSASSRRRSRLRPPCRRPPARAGWQPVAPMEPHPITTTVDSSNRGVRLSRFRPWTHSGSARCTLLRITGTSTEVPTERNTLTDSPRSKSLRQRIGAGRPPGPRASWSQSLYRDETRADAAGSANDGCHDCWGHSQLLRQVRRLHPDRLRRPTHADQPLSPGTPQGAAGYPAR